MRRRTVVWKGMLVILAIAALAACGSSGTSNSGVVLVEDGAADTQTAQTVWVQQHPTPTEGPSPEPTATPAPYAIPTNAPDVDESMVITRVGNEDITLGEFQQRVRFERWFPLYQLVRLAEEHGMEQVFDLTLPENQNTLSLFVTLADSNSFGVQVQRIMVIDAISLQEAARRDLELDTVQFDAEMAQYLGMQITTEGTLPPEFDARYADFLEQLHIYTGMTEEDFRRIVRARALYYELQYLIGQEPGAVPSGDELNIGMEVEDILVSSLSAAERVIERLDAGESMGDIAASLGLASADGSTSRTVRRSDTNLPQETLDAIFSASPGDVIGPVAVPEGWYIAKVSQEVFDLPSPKDVEAMRRQHFLDWVESQMDDPAYTEDYDNWRPYIPQDPLPIDVSPLLREENMTLPEDTSGLPEIDLGDEMLTPEVEMTLGAEGALQAEATAEAEGN